MSRTDKALEYGILPPKVAKDFAGVRGRVRRAVAAAPRSVSFEKASRQVGLFQKISIIPSK
jgi:hypothetical protein